MELLIFRHGIAEPVGPDGTDASRPLSPRGVDRTRLAARGLARIADRPQAILTSPKLRAVQTAELLAEVFDLRPTVLPSLAGSHPAAIGRDLSGRDEAALLLVGHEPTLSRLVALLLVGRAGPGEFIEMKKAGCACVHAPLGPRDAGQPYLRWLATPRILRQLGDC